VAVSRSDAVLLVVAVAAVSTSAPLIREAAAPALAVAFWRNAFASATVIPAAASARRRRTEPASAPADDRLLEAPVGDRPRPEAPAANAGRLKPGSPESPAGGPAARSEDRRAWKLSVVAGLLLAVHFATWIPSLSLTSVSSSVALVATQPVWAALIAGAIGRPVGRSGWFGIALALAGVLLVTGVDVGSSGRALAGDLLALVGGMAAAAYVSVGSHARRRLSTLDYTAGCYSVATVALMAVCLVSHQQVLGFSARTWACLVAITAGPQLLGHSVFNRVVRTAGPTVVSVAVLGEIIGSSLLALWWFGEAPPDGIVPAAACIIAGVILVVRTAKPPAEDVVEAAAV